MKSIIYIIFSVLFIPFIIKGQDKGSYNLLSFSNQIYFADKDALTIFENCNLFITDKIIDNTVPPLSDLSHEDSLSLMLLRSEMFQANYILKHNQLFFLDPRKDKELKELIFKSDRKLSIYEGANRGFKLYFDLLKLTIKNNISGQLSDLMLLQNMFYEKQLIKRMEDKFDTGEIIDEIELVTNKTNQSYIMLFNQVYFSDQEALAVFEKCQVAFTNQVVEKVFQLNYVLSNEDSLKLQMLKSDIFNADYILKRNQKFYIEKKKDKDIISVNFKPDKKIFFYDGPHKGIQLYFEIYKLLTKKRFLPPLNDMILNQIHLLEKQCNSKTERKYNYKIVLKEIENLWIENKK
jgi:hypothetical protein